MPEVSAYLCDKNTGIDPMPKRGRKCHKPVTAEDGGVALTAVLSSVADPAFQDAQQVRFCGELHLRYWLKHYEWTLSDGTEFPETTSEETDTE